MLQELYTSRGEALSGTPWTVYPRPQMKRDSYLNLNGEWEFSTNYGQVCLLLVRSTIYVIRAIKSCVLRLW